MLLNIFDQVAPDDRVICQFEIFQVADAEATTTLMSGHGTRDKI